MKRLLGKLALLAFASSAFLGACGELSRSLILSRNSTELSSVLWTRQFGTRKKDDAYAIAVDGSGNILVAGTTEGTLPAQRWLGERDSFVRKYNSNGNQLWTRQFGSHDHDWASAVALDGSGNVLVAGSTWGSLPDQTRMGRQDAFVRKYDPDGNELWTRQFGTSGTDWASSASVGSIALDGSGNVLVAGSIQGNLPSQARIGVVDSFVRKYDPDGNELWTRQFGVSGSVGFGPRPIAVDVQGNISVAGSTWGTLPGQAWAGRFDVYVRKYDPDGSELWTRQFGSSESDFATFIVMDESGNVLVAGSTEGSLPDQTRVGSQDAFVRKYDPDGNELWTHQFGTRNIDWAYAIAVDRSGNILVAGSTSGTLPGQAWAGRFDAYVRKYDPDGNELWTHQFGTSDVDLVKAIAVDGIGDILVAGSTYGARPGQFWSGKSDAFVRKYRSFPHLAQGAAGEDRKTGAIWP